jgi:hypothetical protein
MNTNIDTPFLTKEFKFSQKAQFKKKERSLINIDNVYKEDDFWKDSLNCLIGIHEWWSEAPNEFDTKMHDFDVFKAHVMKFTDVKSFIVMYMTLEKRFVFYTDQCNVEQHNVLVQGAYNKVNKLRKQYNMLKTELVNIITYHYSMKFASHLPHLVFVAKMKKQQPLLTNSGNFKRMLKHLGLKPVAVRRDSLLSLLVEGFIYNSPYFKLPKNDRRYAKTFWNCFNTLYKSTPFFIQVIATPEVHGSLYPTPSVVIPQYLDDSWTEGIDDEPFLKEKIAEHTALIEHVDTMDMLLKMTLVIKQSIEIVHVRSLKEFIKVCFDSLLMLFGTHTLLSGIVWTVDNINNFMPILYNLLDIAGDYINGPKDAKSIGEALSSVIKEQAAKVGETVNEVANVGAVVAGGAVGIVSGGVDLVVDTIQPALSDAMSKASTTLFGMSKPPQQDDDSSAASVTGFKYGELLHNISDAAYVQVGLSYEKVAFDLLSEEPHNYITQLLRIDDKPFSLFTRNKRKIIHYYIAHGLTYTTIMCGVVGKFVHGEHYSELVTELMERKIRPNEPDGEWGLYERYVMEYRRNKDSYMFLDPIAMLARYENEKVEDIIHLKMMLVVYVSMEHLVKGSGLGVVMDMFRCGTHLSQMFLAHVFDMKIDQIFNFGTDIDFTVIDDLNKDLFADTQSSLVTASQTAGSYKDIFKALQKSEFTHLFKGLIMSMKFSMLSSFIFKHIGYPHINEVISKTFGDFLHDANGLISLTTLCSKLVTEVAPALYYCDPSYLKPADYTDRIDVVQHAVAAGSIFDEPQIIEVINKWRFTEGKVDNVLHVFHDVLGEMLDFVKKFVTNHSYGAVKNILTDLFRVRIAVNNRIKYGMIRTEPFCVGLNGDPGVGKSVFTREIIAELTDVLDLGKLKAVRTLEAELQNEVSVGTIEYLKPVVGTVMSQMDKFCNNVNNSTPVLIFDDAGIVNPDKDNTVQNMFSLFMQVQSNVPTPIPRADLDSKQDQFFNNKLTIITSNIHDYGCSKYITTPGAFMRRIHFSVTMKYKNPHHPSIVDVDYTVRQLKLGTIQFDTFEHQTREDVIRLMRDFAAQYKEYQKTVEKITRFEFCSCCTYLKKYCQCNTLLPEYGVNNISHAVWFHPRINHMHPMEILSAVAMEEMVMYTLLKGGIKLIELGEVNIYECQWIVLIIILGIVRELIEIASTKQRFDVFRWFAFTLVLVHPIEFGVFFHMVFNGWVFSDFITKVRCHADREIDKATLRLVNKIDTEYLPGWTKKMQGAMFDTTSYREQLRNWMYDMFSAKYLIPFSIGVFVAAMSMSQTLNASYTALGDEPSSDDVVENVKLATMVKGNYQSQTDGSANTYKVDAKPVFKKRAGAEPNYMLGNRIIIRMMLQGTDETATFKASYCQGKVYSCNHALNAEISKYDNVNIMYYFINNPSEIFAYSFTRGGVYTIYSHDALSFPHVSNRRSVRLHMDYVAESGDIVNVDGSEYPVQKMGTWRLPSGELQPLGYYAVPNKQERGNSGAPVFLVKRQGVYIDPVFVGVMCARQKDSDLGVFSPIVPVAYNTSLPILEEIISPEMVAERFDPEWKLKPVMDPKSVLKHLEDASGIGEFIGSVDRHVHQSKTKFFETELADKARALIPQTLEFGLVQLSPKVENGVYTNPLLACVRQMASTGDFMNDAPCWSAAKLVKDHIWSVLGDELVKWEPMSLKDALKGTIITNPINRKTAVGYPFKGLVKDELFTGSFAEPMFKAWYAKRIALMIADMDKGIPPLNVSQSSLKDEILKKGKLARAFFSGNMDFLVLCRIYLGALMEIFMANRHRMFAQIGMNAIGKEFHEFLTRMFRQVNGDDADMMDTECWVDSDYEKYDKMVNTLRYAIHIIYWLATEVPFFKQHPEEHNRLVMTLVALLNFVVVLGKDVFLMRNKIPSGVWATTLIGCLCEVIIEVLQFYFLIHIFIYGCKGEAVDFVAKHKDNYKFFQLVALGNYGDDNLKCLNKTVIQYYTNDAIRQFATWIHMGITPARKHEQLIEVKKVTNILFLKRVPVWNSYLHRLVGRLEIASIGKMLAFTDSTDPLWKQAVLDQARRELAFHGEEIYEKFFKIFQLEFIPIESTLSEIDQVQWGVTQKMEAISVDDIELL